MDNRRRPENDNLARLITIGGMLAEAVLTGRTQDEATFRMAETWGALIHTRLGHADQRRDDLTAERWGFGNSSAPETLIG